MSNPWEKWDRQYDGLLDQYQEDFLAEKFLASTTRFGRIRWRIKCFLRRFWT